MKPFIPQKIYIDRKVQNEKVTLNVLKNLGDSSVAPQNDDVVFIDDVKDIGLSSSLEKGREVLLVTSFKGEVFEHCPAGKPGMVCCNYFIFPFAQNCHMDCEYCFLQYYLNKQVMVIYANIEEMLQKLEKALENRKTFCRVGTGEYADSLALDHLTGISTLLIPFFATKKNAVLELKTKTNNIDNLLKMEPGNGTVVAWSINPKSIVDQYEHGTSSLEDRLEAALSCAKAGYKVAFHLDPMIYYEGWEKGYQDLIEIIYEKVGQYSIEWISLGNLRMTSDLKTMMKLRFPNSPLWGEEMVRGIDGKFRYPKKLRIEMYQKIWNFILEKRGDQKMYLCMEHPDIWSQVAPPKTSNYFFSRSFSSASSF